jgi:hypothetical protein
MTGHPTNMTGDWQAQESALHSVLRKAEVQKRAWVTQSSTQHLSSATERTLQHPRTAFWDGEPASQQGICFPPPFRAFITRRHWPKIIYYCSLHTHITTPIAKLKAACRKNMYFSLANKSGQNAHKHVVPTFFDTNPTPDTVPLQHDAQYAHVTRARTPRTKHTRARTRNRKNDKLLSPGSPQRPSTSTHPLPALPHTRQCMRKKGAPRRGQKVNCRKVTRTSNARHPTGGRKHVRLDSQFKAPKRAWKQRLPRHPKRSWRGNCIGYINTQWGQANTGRATESFY